MILPQNPGVNKLIIVEGLTGLGKSTMAHFIARQLHYQDIEATWIHEGELEHPLSVEVDSREIDLFMQSTLDMWRSFVSQIECSEVITILEAALFNNLFETLFMHNVAIYTIHQFSDRVQDIIKPLQPALVYLTQSDVRQALKKNFNNRGAGFRDYVIKFTTGTPYAQHKGLQGYEGMLKFWNDFVALTDECFDRFRFRKIALDNSNGDWDRIKSKVIEFLEIPQVIERLVSDKEAARYTGTYVEENSGRKFIVQYPNDELIINFFLEDWTRLIPAAVGTFIAEGWHFIIRFDNDSSGKISSIRIEGQDIDYFSLVGTVAKKVTS